MKDKQEVRRITEHHIGGRNSLLELSCVNSGDRPYYQVEFVGTAEPDFVVALRNDGDQQTKLTIEVLLAISLDNLKITNDGSQACRENSLVITKIEEALLWLRKKHERISRQRGLHD